MKTDTHILLDIAEHLHVEQGASTAEIAELMGRTKDTVKRGLWGRGVLRPSLGKDIEQEVAAWLTRQGKRVVLQKGDAPFDLLVDDERVDVKSAHRSKSGASWAYRFQLQDVTKRVSLKNFAYELDSFYLVFLDDDGAPVYRLKSVAVKIRCGLSVTHIGRSKYPMQLLGYLRPMAS